MTWAYIVGFFDGEGNINARGHGIALFQNHLGVLQEIADFLRGEGLVSPKYRVKESGFRPDGTKRCNVLKYSRKGDVLKFLNGVLPYLIVKRRLAEDLRRFLIIYPSLTAKQASLIGNQTSTKLARLAYGHVGTDGRSTRNKRP